MDWGWLTSKTMLQFKLLNIDEANEWLSTIQPFRIRTYQVSANGEKLVVFYEEKCE